MANQSPELSIEKLREIYFHHIPLYNRCDWSDPWVTAVRRLFFHALWERAMRKKAEFDYNHGERDHNSRRCYSCNTHRGWTDDDWFKAECKEVGVEEEK